MPLPPTTFPRFVETADAMRAAFTDAFDGTDGSPTALEAAFRDLAVDPFELFLLECVRPRAGQLPETAADYRHAVERWETFMTDAGRHPACPRPSDVRAFERRLSERADETCQPCRTLRLLGRVYRFWRDEPTLPHGDEDDPFVTVLTECEQK